MKSNTGKTNLNSYSSPNAAFPKGSATQTEYASAKVLNKAKAGGELRAPEYKLENIKK
jgi:hypothetical protein